MKLFRNKKLYKEIIEGKYTSEEIRPKLKELSTKKLRKIGKKIIYSDYDGYNYLSVSSKMCYFDDLSREQKEFYVEQKLYKLL